MVTGFNKVYYSLKPLLPLRLRLVVRQWMARYRRASNAHVWPVDERAGVPPTGWPGWPDRKQFALVLTHDVEDRKGLQRVEQLMNLELTYGFRCHSGIEVMTPASTHDGRAHVLFEQRAEILNVVFLANPKRFKGRAPHPPKLPTAAWINPPKQETTTTPDPSTVISCNLVSQCL